MAENNPPDHEIEEDPEENSSDQIEEDNSSSSDESEVDNSSDVCEGENIPEVVIKKRKIVEEDDTEETLQLLLQQRNNGDQPQNIPPARIIGLSHYGKCIYKQLTESDVSVSQNRLMLGKQEVKDKFLRRLQESEIPGKEGVDVLVYGPDGNVHEMKFKIWIKNTPVFANGWSKFVKAYGLEKYRDVLTIWMFKASEDRKICFAIDSTRFDGITKQLSKRIFKNVFKS